MESHASLSFRVIVLRQMKFSFAKDKPDEIESSGPRALTLFCDFARVLLYLAKKDRSLWWNLVRVANGKVIARYQ